MPQRWEPHPDEETIESYVMGRLAIDRFQSVDEHLLICERCRRQVTETERFLDAMRHTVAPVQSIRHEPAPPMIANPECD